MDELVEGVVAPEGLQPLVELGSQVAVPLDGAHSRARDDLDRPLEGRRRRNAALVRLAALVLLALALVLLVASLLLRVAGQHPVLDARRDAAEGLGREGDEERLLAKGAVLSGGGAHAQRDQARETARVTSRADDVVSVGDLEAYTAEQHLRLVEGQGHRVVPVVRRRLACHGVWLVD